MQLLADACWRNMQEAACGWSGKVTRLVQSSRDVEKEVGCAQEANWISIKLEVLPALLALLPPLVYLSFSDSDVPIFILGFSTNLPL